MLFKQSFVKRVGVEYESANLCRKCTSNLNIASHPVPVSSRQGWLKLSSGINNVICISYWRPWTILYVAICHAGGETLHRQLLCVSCESHWGHQNLPSNRTTHLQYWTVYAPPILSNICNFRSLTQSGSFICISYIPATQMCLSNKHTYG